MQSGRLGVAVTDQVVASAAWYVPVLIVARGATPSEFGVFLVAYGALAMMVAVSRSMFGVVLGMDLPPGADASGSRHVRLAAGGVLVLAMGTAAAFGMVAPLVGDAGILVALLGVAAVVVMPQDLARFAATSIGSPTRALLADAVWLLPPLVGLAGDLVGGWALTSTAGLLLWIGSAAASLVVAALVRLVGKPCFRGLWSWWRGDLRRRHLAGDSLLSGAAPVANGWGAALVAGTSAVAAVRGASMLFAPIATLMQAMTLAAVPEARRTPADAVRLLTTLTVLVALSSVVWGLMASLLPASIGRELLGDSWPLADPVIPVVSLEYAGLALWTGGAALLRYASDTRSVWHVRLAYAPAAALLPVLALALGGDPRAFVAVLAALAWVVGLTAFLRGLRAARNCG